MTSTYAWIITEDHITSPRDDTHTVGISGPSDATPELLDRLGRGDGHTFELYDDDRILYYRGRLVTADDEMDDDACIAPLQDFGEGWAGCVAVQWPGHPEWDCS